MLLNSELTRTSSTSLWPLRLILSLIISLNSEFLKSLTYFPSLNDLFALILLNVLRDILWLDLLPEFTVKKESDDLFELLIGSLL